MNENLTFKLEVSLGNDAFVPGWGAEVARILRHAADLVDGHEGTPGIVGGGLRDINGNRVGLYEVDAS